MGQYVSFYVSVVGQAHSRHRSPEGVYQIDVLDGASSQQIAAEAALSSALRHIPFLEDDASRFSIRLFTDDGEEFVLPLTGSSPHESKACYCGRAFDYPDFIMIQ